MRHLLTKIPSIIVAVAYLVDTASSSSGDTPISTPPDQANITAPMTRQQIIAANPTQTPMDIENDPAFKTCTSGDKGSQSCQDAQTRQLALMTQTHQDVVSDLTNVAVQLTAVNAAQAVGDAKISSMNSAIYGDGSGNNMGLVNMLQRVALALQDIQTTVQEQSADIANKSAAVRTSTDMQVQNVRKVMDTKLSDVESQINALLTGQATGQQQALVNSATNMQNAAQAASATITANSNNLNKAVSGLSDAADILEVDTTTTLNDLSTELASTTDNLKAVNGTAGAMIDAFKTNMTEESTKAISEATAQGKSAISTKTADAQKALAETQAEAYKQVAAGREALESDVSNLKTDTQAHLAGVQNEFSKNQQANQNTLNQLSSTASSGTASLSSAQQQSGKDLAASAQLSRDEMNKLLGLIQAYKQSTGASVGTVQNLLAGLVGPMQQTVADQLKNQGQSTGNELVNMNSQIATVMDKIKSQGGNAQTALLSYLSNIQSQAGKDSQNQQGALTDAQAAIEAARALANGELQLQSDKASSAAQTLFSLFQGSLEDTSGTVNDVNTANAAKQRDMQRAFLQMMLDKQNALNKDVGQAQYQQQQGVNDLKTDQATKSQQIAALIAQLSSIFSQAESSAQYSQTAVADLLSQVSNSQGVADGELARLLGIVQESGAAANAGASGANSQIQFAVSGMQDQLVETLKRYSGQFSGDFSDAIARLNGLSKSTMDQLQASSGNQMKSTGDAETLAKSLLADLDKLKQSGSSETNALASLFRSKALAAGLDRQSKIKGVTDDAQSQMSELEKKIMAMILSQTSSLAASTGQTVNNQKDQLNHLMDLLRSQQVSASQLASRTQGAIQNVEKWTSDLSDQISTAQGKAGDAKELQLKMVQALENDLNDWSSTLDKNISDVRAQLEEGMAMIPNVTASKAEDTEKMFSQSNTQMQGYLGTLKRAFDRMRTTEADYVKQQSLRRLATLLGIDRASLDNSNVLMQLLGVTDLNQLGDQQQISTVLAGLADGVAGLESKDSQAYASLRDSITNLDSNSKGLFGKLMNKASGSLTDLYNKYAADQHALQMTIEAAADKDNIRSQAMDDALNGMLGSVRNGALVLNGQLANDRKDLYALDGSVRQLGDDSSLALGRLIRTAESQSESVDSALAMSQKVNGDRVASVRDVVIAFVKAMEEYVGESRNGFEDIHSKLNDYKSFLDSKLNTSDSFMLGMAQSTQSELEAVSGMVDALQSRVDSFNNRAKQQLYNLEEERSALQARHEREMTDLKQRLQTASTQIQDDQDSTSQQVEYWLSEEDSDLGFTDGKKPSLVEIHPHDVVGVVV